MQEEVVLRNLFPCESTVSKLFQRLPDVTGFIIKTSKSLHNVQLLFFK